MWLYWGLSRNNFFPIINLEKNISSDRWTKIFQPKLCFCCYKSQKKPKNSTAHFSLNLSLSYRFQQQPSECYLRCCKISSSHTICEHIQEMGKIPYRIFDDWIKYDVLASVLLNERVNEEYI